MLQRAVPTRRKPREEIQPCRWAVASVGNSGVPTEPRRYVSPALLRVFIVPGLMCLLFAAGSAMGLAGHSGGVSVTGDGKIVAAASEGQPFFMKQAGEEILAVQSAGLVSFSGLARTDEFADATSVAISGGGSAGQSGGSVRLRPGDGTSSASAQLLGANLGGHEAAGGVQISGDGAVGVAARGGQSVNIQSGAGLAGTLINNISLCHSLDLPYHGTYL